MRHGTIAHAHVELGAQKKKPSTPSSILLRHTCLNLHQHSGVGYGKLPLLCLVTAELSPYMAKRFLSCSVAWCGSVLSMYHFNLHMRKLSYWTMIFMKTVEATNWKSSFEKRNRWKWELFGNQTWERISWNRIMCVGSYWICQDITPFWKTVFWFFGQPWRLVCRWLESLWNPGFFAICTECSPIYCVISKCR